MAKHSTRAMRGALHPLPASPWSNGRILCPERDPVDRSNTISLQHKSPASRCCKAVSANSGLKRWRRGGAHISGRGNARHCYERRLSKTGCCATTLRTERILSFQNASNAQRWWHTLHPCSMTNNQHICYVMAPAAVPYRLSVRVHRAPDKSTTADSKTAQKKKKMLCLTHLAGCRLHRQQR